MKDLMGSPANSLHIAHTGEGAALTVVEAPDLCLADAMGPDTWPDQGFTLVKAPVPFYIPTVTLEQGWAGGGKGDW